MFARGRGQWSKSVSNMSCRKPRQDGYSIFGFVEHKGKTKTKLVLECIIYGKSVLVQRRTFHLLLRSRDGRRFRCLTMILVLFDPVTSLVTSANCRCSLILQVPEFSGSKHSEAKSVCQNKTEWTGASVYWATEQTLVLDMHKWAIWI